MVPSTSSLKVARQWLYGTYRVEYQLRHQLGPGQLSNLVDSAIRHLLPPQVRELSSDEQAHLTDLKGQDVRPVITSLTGGSPAAPLDEILYLEGFIADCDEDSDKNQEEPFQACLYSTFSEFSADGHITHTAQIATNGALPHRLRLKFWGSCVPLRPTLFRLGIDLFTFPKMLGWLSGTPTVTQTLVIEAVEQEVKLSFIAERLPTQDAPWLVTNERRQALDTLLKQTLGVSLKEILDQTARR